MSHEQTIMPSSHWQRSALEDGKWNGMEFTQFPHLNRAVKIMMKEKSDFSAFTANYLENSYMHGINWKKTPNLKAG